MVANLEDAVRVAERRFNESKASLADAEAKSADKRGDYEEAEAEVITKQDELAVIKQEQDPDPNKVQAAENAVRDAQRRRDSAKRVYNLAIESERKARNSVDAADLALGQAMRALKDYKLNNKPQQN